MLLASLAAFVATPSPSRAERIPCTDEQAAQTGGRFTAEPEARADADLRALRSRFPPLALAADRALALVQQVLPRLQGVQARAHRTVDARSLNGSGRVRFGLSTGVFAYYCVPATGYAPDIAGTIRLGDESGLWIDVAFNSLSWLAHERRQVGDLHLPDGSAIYFAARERGSLRGVPVYLPEVNASRAEEAIVLGAGGRSPWLPVTRAGLLDARIAAVQQRLAPVPAGAAVRGRLEAERDALVAARAGLSAEERAAPAVVTDPYAPPAALFVPASGPGVALARVDRTLFARDAPRDQVALVTVAWRWDPHVARDAALIAQFKEGFDVRALAALLAGP